MSRAWHGDAFDAGRAAPAPLGLSRTLAHALFGAALGSLPSAAIAEDKDDLIPATLPATVSAEQRTYGPLRPGLGTPANTMAPGVVSIETGLVDWERDDSDGARADTILLGATTVRVGITRSVEAMVGWTPVGHVRVRDASGTIEQANRVGDATIGFKANVLNPDGSGLSAAVQPFLVVPVGRMPVGVGDWGGGVVLPISYDLNPSVNIAVTTEIDAATNGSGRGRRLAYDFVAGIGVAVGPTVKVTGELSAGRDNDSDAPLRQCFASMSIAWSARGDLQFDVGAAAGLTRDSPDLRLYAGLSRRF